MKNKFTSTACHSIRTFEAQCATCHKKFHAPSLGDFSYAQFILFGNRGTVYAYLNAINHPIWNLAQSVLGPSNPTLLQTVASLADPIDGQTLTSLPVCPFCQSTNWKSGASTPAATIQIPEATFNIFNQLSPHQQQKLLKAK